MELIIAAVGSPKRGGVAEAILDYEERAGRYFRLRTIEVPPAALTDPEAERARSTEGEALLRRVPETLEVIAVTRRGKPMSSRGLARYLGDLATYSMPGAAFLLGGAHGLSDRVIERASRRLSLSELTLPHGLARLVLAEQLYRAGTILRGEPYHKGR